MNQRYTIGIDIGGTNTDAVFINQDGILLKSTKTTTTANVTEGFSAALQDVITGYPANSITHIKVGTTHATNALLQHNNLFTVGIIRIAGHNPQLPPYYNWPSSLKKTVFRGVSTIDGGFECSGQSITPFNPDQAIKAAQQLQTQGAESIALVGVFSPLNASQEELAAEAIKNSLGSSLSITCSAHVGGIGFIERENAAILNSALKKSLINGFQDLAQAAHSLGLTAARLSFVQNNGTIIDMHTACMYPLFTLSAGPTNSFIGGAKLAGLTEALVIDIGGTSTDVGLIKNGFPRRTLNSSTIANIPLNFPAPDVCSTALGGGTCIKIDNETPCLESKSVGNRLLIDSVSFGGSSLTLTDVALKAGLITIKNAEPDRVSLTKQQIDSLYAQIKNRLQELIEKMRGPEQNISIVLVGGGATLLPPNLIPNAITCPHANVANAYGAALAEISATVDTVVSLTQRDIILTELRNQALNLAVEQGAAASLVRVIEEKIIPYHYIPNNLARIIITAAGGQ